MNMANATDLLLVCLLRRLIGNLLLLLSRVFALARRSRDIHQMVHSAASKEGTSTCSGQDKPVDCINRSCASGEEADGTAADLGNVC